MKFDFDARQDYQLEAIASTVDLFDGNETYFSDAELITHSGIIANRITLKEEELLHNLNVVQQRNKLPVSTEFAGMHYSIEMETGTGKTYVYLRTIFELYNKYKFRKFIIIVPSIAIKEGVLKTLEITEDHFKDIYQGVMYRYYEYDSDKINMIRQFAESNIIEIMVMTMGSFNKDINVINRKVEKLDDKIPLEIIQQTNPILILDEPQNMEGEATREALDRFNYAFTLRYSATHRNKYNFVYQLAPWDAYNKGLVKKIEVVSVVDENNFSNVMIECLDIETKRTGLTAKVRINALQPDGNIKTKIFTVKNETNLYEKSKLPYYEGFVINEINYAEGYISFSNGCTIKKGEILEDDKQEIMSNQIEQTVIEHFNKKKRLNPKGIKVLSLFFIDKVDNYLQPEGFIRKCFIEAFNKYSNEEKYKDLYKDIPVEKVHNGYFSKLKTEKGMENDKEIYNLIMKDKEKLLSLNEPLEFIFSHTALREGWDNPNIFNICTLNETVSTIKKRQEIGRGVRLCVDNTGKRIFDTDINRLSVIANESYRSYCENLQNEYIEEYGEENASKIKMPDNGRARVTVKVKDGFDKNPYFSELWNRIKHKTSYSVAINTDQFVEDCIKEINKIVVLERKIGIYKNVIEKIEDKGKTIQSTYVAQKTKDAEPSAVMPDIVSLIEQNTHITKKTILRILKGLDNPAKILINPYDFVAKATKIIKDVLLNYKVEYVQYERVEQEYDLNIFRDIETYEYKTLAVQNSIYDAVVYDLSRTELNFAKELDSDGRIKLFIKLPNRYRIPTPVGYYIPDWALVIEERDLDTEEVTTKIYFIAETKDTGSGDVDTNRLRGIENMKIVCARKSFGILNDIDYDVVKDLQDIFAACEKRKAMANN